MKKFLYFLTILSLLTFLLLFPVQALESSRRGLDLWFFTLLPTLLPFLILSNVLLHANLIPRMTGFIAPLFRFLLGISSSGTYALLTGFLCGYPVGAKILAQLKISGQIPELEADYLLSFCNNVSPAFLITFLVNEQLGQPDLLIPTLFLVYGAPLLYGILKNPAFRQKTKAMENRLFTIKKAPIVQINFELIDACILDAVKTMIKLGAYIILFSILAKILEMLPFLPDGTKALCIGVTEITGGIAWIVHRYPLKICYPLLIALTTFGGISSLAQTESVACGARFSIRSYINSKIITSLAAGAGALLFLSLI